MPDRAAQSPRDRGSRHRRDRAKPQTLHWRRARTGGGRERSCRGAARFDGPPQRRDLDDRRIEADKERPNKGSRARAASASRRIESQRSTRDEIRSGTMLIPQSSALNLARAGCGACANISPSRAGASPAKAPAQANRPFADCKRAVMSAVRRYGGTSPEAEPSDVLSPGADRSAGSGAACAAP